MVFWSGVGLLSPCSTHQDVAPCQTANLFISSTVAPFTELLKHYPDIQWVIVLNENTDFLVDRWEHLQQHSLLYTGFLLYRSCWSLIQQCSWALPSPGGVPSSPPTPELLYKLHPFPPSVCYSTCRLSSTASGPTNTQVPTNTTTTTTTTYLFTRLERI